MCQILFRKKLLFILLFFVLFDVFLAIFYFNPVLLQKTLSLFEPQPGSCLILEERYCGQAETVYYQDQVFAVGFTLPQNAPIFAPFDGIFINGGSITLKGEGISYPSVSIMTDIEGDKVWDAKKHFKAVFYQESVRDDEEEVNAQEIIGRVSAKPIEFSSPHNLVVYFSFPNDENFIKRDVEYTLDFFNL